MSKVIAYLRVSTDEQARSGLGLEAQLEEIRRAQGEPDAIYQDDGFSGSDPKRPALIEALNMLASGDVLAVAKRDRLARDVYLSAWIEKETKRRGARVVSAAGEGTENDDPASVLMRSIVDAFAAYERNLIGARTAAAMASKQRRGEFTGGKVPFGFQLADDGVHLVEDPAERRVIALVRDLQAEGLSLRKIGAELERRGVKTKQGGNTWNPKVVRDLLRKAA